MTGTPNPSIANSALTLRAGEPFVLHVALRDAAGVPQLLSGRAFALLIAAVGAIDAEIRAAATLSGDGLYAIITLNGTQTAALHADFAARALAYAIVEVIGDTQVTRGAGSLRVEASAAIPSDDDPATIDLPYALAIPSAAGLLITETGARGLSAAEQFAIGGLADGDPMTNAMFAALGEVAVIAADAANAAAENAGEKAALAQGVVDAQAANLAAIAGAREATAADREQVSISKSAVLAANIDVIENASMVATDRLTIEGYRDQVVMAASTANDAMAAAVLSANRYGNTGAGLAATTSGQYFAVVGTGDIYLLLYRNDSGSATFVNSIASKSFIDDLLAMMRPDVTDTIWSWKVTNLNGDILYGFRNSIQGLDVPNLRALFAITAGSMSADSLTVNNTLTVGGGQISSTLNPGNIHEWRTPIGDIVAKIDTTGTLTVPAVVASGALAIGGGGSIGGSLAVTGGLTVGGALAVGSMSLSGALSAGSLTLAAGAVRSVLSGNLYEWTTPLGDIIARIDAQGIPHFAGGVIEGNLVVTGSISGSIAGNTPTPAPFSTIPSADLAVINAVTPPGPSDVALPPVLSNDTATYGTRHSHISGSVARTGSRWWGYGNGKLGVTTITGYIAGNVLTVLSITNPGAISADGLAAVVTGSGVTAGTTIDGTGTGVGTYTTSISQTVGSAGSPVAMTITDAANDGAEGASAFNFVRYTDDLATGNWKECLYLLPPDPRTCSAGDPQIARTPDGRLLITIPMNGPSPLVRGSYAYLINNPEAVSGSFDISGPFWLYKGIAMQPRAVGGEMFVTIDEGASGGPYSHFGKLTFAGRSVSFSFISDVTRVPTAAANFNESSIAPITGNRWMAFCRSADGIYQFTSTASAASWGAPVLWSPISGYVSCPSARSCFGRSPSGRLIAVWNMDPTNRRHLTVALSEDSGASWPWYLEIESRSLTSQGPSYPAIEFDEDGYLYVIYDFGRRPDAATGKKMLIAKISEALIRAGTATEADVTKFVMTN